MKKAPARGRPRPVLRTPEQHRERRAAQAARAYAAGRRVDENWARIERHLLDGHKRPSVFGIDIPTDIAARLWPEPPAVAAEVPIVTTEEAA